MFGFSLTKLLFTALAIFVVWRGFRWYAERQSRVARGDGGKPVSGGGAAPADAEEMKQCPVCNAYVVQKGATACGREGCPFPG